MTNHKQDLIGALYILRNVMKNYDTEIAHNILIDGGTDQTEEEMEKELEEYIETLDELISFVDSKL
jgi:hypothetical protein